MQTPTPSKFAKLGSWSKKMRNVLKRSKKQFSDFSNFYFLEIWSLKIRRKLGKVPFFCPRRSVMFWNGCSTDFHSFAIFRFWDVIDQNVIINDQNIEFAQILLAIRSECVWEDSGLFLVNNIQTSYRSSQFFFAYVSEDFKQKKIFDKFFSRQNYNMVE